MIIIKAILTIVLTLSTFICRGWEYELKGLASESIVPVTSVELPNGDILLLYYKVAEYGNPDSVISNNLLRINSEGNLIDNLDYSDFLSGYKFYGNGMKYVNDEIIICGTAIDSQYQEYPAILKLSDDLSFIYDTIFNFNGRANKIWTLPDSGYIIWGIIGDVFTGTSTFWKLDEHFIIQNTGFNTTPWLKDGEPALTASGNFLYDIYDLYALRKWDVSSFNLVKFFQPQNSSLYFNTPVISVDEDVIFIAGKIIDPLRLQHQNLILFKLDDNLNPLDSAIYKDTAENRIPDFANAIAIVNDHYCYLGASNNQPSIGLVNKNTRYSAFMLLKYEEDMNLVWAKKYRNDCAYRMSFLMKTQDNGILMVGERWNWPEDSLKKEVSLYVLKVDENGNPTGVDEQKYNSPKLTIYPNPSSDFVHINLLGNGEYEVKTIKVVNILGESVYHTEFKGSQYKLDSSQWPAGTYFISVTTKQGKETGRFVKL